MGTLLNFFNYGDAMEYKEIKSDDFIDELKKIPSNLDIDFIQNVLDFSVKAHVNQFRDSGEPYIQHPLHVALILADINMDTSTIAAGLLHDVIEDTPHSSKDLIKKFGNEITNLVNGVTKLESFEYKAGRARKQAENFRHLLFSMTQDIRIIIIKLADRLHNMRTLDSLPPEKQQRIARETMDIYAPLANRFGMAKFQWELEDLSFKYIHPREYRKLVKLINQKKADGDKAIEAIRKDFSSLMIKESIKGEVLGRNKHFYSIYRKNKIKKIRFEDILDLYGLRIILASVEDCYKTLGIIQSQFQVMPNSLKDYINRPKPNNYKSLHIVVTDDAGRNIEIQIRTREMHYIAEEGIAAHWRYKESAAEDKTMKSAAKDINLTAGYDNQISWIRRFLKHQEDVNPEEFIDILKKSLFPDSIVVCTPNADYIKLPRHSSAIDLAFKIHTAIGLHCSGAIINGKHAPIRQELFNGDEVKILTNPQSRPSKDWLNDTNSSRVQHKIRAYFRKVEMQHQLEVGKELFFKRARKAHLKIKTDKEINNLARKMNIFDNQTFFAQLGAGIITFEDILAILNPSLNEVKIQETETPTEDVQLEIKRSHVDGIIIGDIDQLMIRYAKCCNPVPGDSIVGYTTRGRGITIHREDCKNPGFVNQQKTEPGRIIKAYWKYKNEDKR